MRIVLQRVSRAAVRVRGETVAEIGTGFLLLVGVGGDDAFGQYDRRAEKVVHLRVFEDEAGKKNRALAEVGGEVLVLPQFTLYGDVRDGHRDPGARPAPPDVARAWSGAFARALEAAGATVN